MTKAYRLGLCSGVWVTLTGQPARWGMYAVIVGTGETLVVRESTVNRGVMLKVHAV